MRVLALCAGALFVTGCGLLSGTEATATPTRAMAAVVPTFTSTPEGAMAAQTSGGGATTQQAAPAAQQQQAPQATDTPAPTDTPVPTVARFTVKTDLTATNVNVRTGPSTLFTIIGTVARGAQFDISGRNQDYSWYQFSLNGQTGWIFSNLVDVENAHLITLAQNIPIPPTATPVPPTPVPTPVPAPVHVDHCAGIGGDGCKFRLRDKDPAEAGGGALKLRIAFVHGGRGDEVQKYGGYFVELQKDGAQVHGVDHNTRAGTSTVRGPKGDIYHYSKDIPFNQLPGGNAAGTYTIWVMDGNRERDSQNYHFTMSGNQNLIWLVFDQN
ncbi:MAG: SH3 domain-containing protein [Caldilineaceae bacterium SB0668_bin_21]|nr:SH3 domain-containing protein [Caldilineaceae bacterium SB0668_bin_21]MYC24094.1 SH3 domain-containing protein [Caldilineaceae bacterium SB0662_bin_25]